ncbi:MAG: hypothetical protein WD336_04220 [Trueperaceae bacterium]
MRGLRALRPSERRKVHIADLRRWTGSIDLDETLKHDPTEGRQSRWDYGIGFDDASGNRAAVWVEVHPASNPRSVRDVVDKAAWLRRWLARHGPELLDRTHRAEAHLNDAPYVWITTEGVDLPNPAKTKRHLAQHGLSGPVRGLRIP